MRGSGMSSARSITDFELKRLADAAKREKVRIRYQRSPDAPVIEILPDIPATPKQTAVDESEEIVL